MHLTIRNAMAPMMMAATLLTGCAQGPTQSELANANYGSEISQEDCERIAQETISARLKDSESAKFRFKTCDKGWMPSAPMFGMPVQYGYMQVGEVNGKNSFGGYVGFKEFYVLIRSGSPIRAAIDDGTGMFIPWRP